MFVVSVPPHSEIGPNDHREDAPHFSFSSRGTAMLLTDQCNEMIFKFVTKIFRHQRRPISTLQNLTNRFFRLFLMIHY